MKEKKTTKNASNTSESSGYKISGVNLCKALKDKHMTGKELADRLGTSEQTISSYRKHDGNCRKSTLDRMAEILDVTPNFLQGLPDSPSEHFFKTKLPRHKAIKPLLDYIGIDVVYKDDTLFYRPDRNAEYVPIDVNMYEYLVSLSQKLVKEVFVEHYGSVVNYTGAKGYDAINKERIKKGGGEMVEVVYTIPSAKKDRH